MDEDLEDDADDEGAVEDVVVGDENEGLIRVDGGSNWVAVVGTGPATNPCCVDGPNEMDGCVTDTGFPLTFVS